MVGSIDIRPFLCRQPHAFVRDMTLLHTPLPLLSLSLDLQYTEGDDEFEEEIEEYEEEYEKEEEEYEEEAEEVRACKTARPIFLPRCNNYNHVFKISF